MQESQDQICPWCQTEIVWDPEIGPEENCPHCYSDLGNYRSLKLSGQDLLLDEEDEADDENEYKANKAAEIDEEVDNEADNEEDLSEDDNYDDDYMDGPDDYEEGAQRVLDLQEETPECPTCHSFMMYAGTQTADSGFVPFVPALLKKPLLKAAYTTKVYVCPSCFKINHIMADEDRLAMIELLKNHAQ
jgi:hypothetical protein